ncbi:hypothetical protein [Roseateles violae]|uniref:Uncharacterized protein n=1 Tax=Roseateles violae TaxID=3058042 RepID=A0ABT8DXQ0_9BURK|nr:hypothetical protein [Pelomonas sp. PFR6]MDN3922335.1 hypothetical protein [Pelomonas sp. PFR6]
MSRFFRTSSVRKLLVIAGLGGLALLSGCERRPSTPDTPTTTAPSTTSPSTAPASAASGP